MANIIPRPTIAIVGGGVGGTVLANLLARELDEEEARLVLIDQRGHHLYQPGWLYLPFNGQDPEHLERSERSLLRHRIDLYISRVERVDTAKRSLLLADPLALGQTSACTTTTWSLPAGRASRLRKFRVCRKRWRRAARSSSTPRRARSACAWRCSSSRAGTSPLPSAAFPINAHPRRWSSRSCSKRTCASAACASRRRSPTTRPCRAPSPSKASPTSKIP